MLKLRQAGDTIVEVMIVLAVLGLALGISYATANRSLLNARQAQENSTATELAQGQIEQLRLLAAQPSIFQPGAFCIYGSGTIEPNPQTGTGNCYVDNLYNLSIIYNQSATAPTFAVTVTWNDVLGQGSDTVKLSYRLYP